MKYIELDNFPLEMSLIPYKGFYKENNSKRMIYIFVSRYQCMIKSRPYVKEKESYKELYDIH